MLADVFETAFQQILFCTAAYLHAPRALTNRQVDIIWNVKKRKANNSSFCDFMSKYVVVFFFRLPHCLFYITEFNKI